MATFVCENGTTNSVRKWANGDEKVVIIKVGEQSKILFLVIHRRAPTSFCYGIKV